MTAARLGIAIYFAELPHQRSRFKSFHGHKYISSFLFYWWWLMKQGWRWLV